MTVVVLPSRKRVGGTTTADSRLASRFLFARPGWRMVEQRDGQHEPYLEITFSPAEGGPALRWHMRRRRDAIIVGRPGSDSVLGPFSSVQDAMLALWEAAEAACSNPVSKPAIVLFGLDMRSEVDLQDLASDAGFGTLTTAEPDAVMELLASGRVAAVIIDLDLPPQHCTAREVIRRLRQCRPGLPVLVLTSYPPTAPEADLHGLGGPTHRERLPYDSDRVVHWLRSLPDAHDGETEADNTRES